MENFTTTVARNSLFSISGQFVLKIVSFLFAVLVVRRLGDTSYGKYSTVLAFVGIFAIFSDFGMSPFALREIAKDRNKTALLFWNVLLLRLVLSVIVVVCIVFLAMALNYSQDIVIGIFIASLGLFLYAVQGPLDVILCAHERVDYSAVFSVVNQVIFVLFGTIMLLWEKGFIGLIIASFVGLIISSILSVIVITRKSGHIPFTIDIRFWPSLIWAGVPFGVMELMTMITMRLDVLILSYFWGNAAVGQYSAVYNNLILTLVLIAQGFSRALFPSLAKKYAIAPENVPSIYYQAMKYLSMLIIPIAVGGTILGDEIIVFLYGQEFAPAIPLLKILVWGLPIMFINSLCTNLTKVSNREKESARVSTVNAVLSATLNLLLIPTYGVVGSAIVKVFTEMTGLVQYIFILKKDFSNLNPIDCFIKPSIAALIMGVFVLLGKSTNIYWVLLIVSGAIMYIVLLFLSKAFEIAELRVISKAFSRPVIIPPGPGDPSQKTT